jgi:hypothetical protein
MYETPANISRPFLMDVPLLTIMCQLLALVFPPFLIMYETPATIFQSFITIVPLLAIMCQLLALVFFSWHYIASDA